MAKKREKREIIHDILKIIGERNGKIKPTHILYKCNLSHQTMGEYIKELLNNNLIEQIILDKHKSYILTEKGIDFLKKYMFMTEFMDSFGLK